MADIIYPRNNPHRKNRDGTWDSICLTCFATIATTPVEPDLTQPERLHVCTPAVLSQRSADELAPNGKATLAEIKKLLEDADPNITVAEFLPSPLVKKVTLH